MESPDRTEATRAFALAYFFHPDRLTALRVATEAFVKLKLAERAQARRGYYRLRGRRSFRGALAVRLRTKVSVERAQLLQRLVLLEVDALERQRESEGGARVDADRFVLGFVRHLVAIACRRNSLYVTTAIGRLLHGYSTAESQELFSSIVQDPERVPDDAYVRLVKQKLLRDLKERFVGLVRTRVGPRGEEVIDAVEPSPRLQQLVRSCLERLTPWDTPCPVPPHFDPLRETLKSLRFAGEDPDAEHPVEMRRMHALVHPRCFARLTSGLRLRSPAEVLSVPRLLGPDEPSDEAGGGGDRSQPPELHEADLDRLRSRLRSEEAARRSAAITHVTLRVDGRERARLELAPEAVAKVVIEDRPEVLEIGGVADGREVALALHLLGPLPLGRDADTGELVVELGRGWEVRIRVELRSANGAAAVTEVELGCRVRRFGHLRRLWRGEPRRWPEWAPWSAGLVPVLVALAVVGLFGRLREIEAPNGVPPSEPTAGSGSTAPGETTRTGSPSGEPATLRTARRVYVGSVAGPGAEVVADLLRRHLDAGGSFDAVDDPEVAEVAIKGRTELRAGDHLGGGPAACHLELRLVDERGALLWSVTSRAPDWETAVGVALADLAARKAAAE